MRNPRALVSVLVISAVGLPLAPSHAQNKPSSAAPPAKTTPKKRKQSPMEQANREFARLEKVTGKPLTVVQKATLVKAFMERRAALKAANDKFEETTARTLGMPVETLKKQYKAIRDEERKAARAKAKSAAPRPVVAQSNAPAGKR